MRRERQRNTGAWLAFALAFTAGCQAAKAPAPEASKAAATEAAKPPPPPPPPASTCEDGKGTGGHAATLKAFSSEGTHGIDVSHYNGPVGWKSLASAGLEYVFVKASEGSSEADPRFAEHWAAAKRCGLARGAYHFLHPDEDPVKQAQHFLAVLADDAGELPPVIDVERGAQGTHRECAELQAAVKGFVDTVERELGRPVMIYSGHSFWKEKLCDTKAFSDRPLWVARYASQPPELFGGWKSWTFWQYTDHFRTPTNALDLDRASEAGTKLVRSPR